MAYISCCASGSVGRPVDPQCLAADYGDIIFVSLSERHAHTAVEFCVWFRL